MAVDNRNRDRLQVTTQFLPDIPLEGSYALQNLLSDMKSRLEELWTNPAPPAQPGGVTITANNLGNNVAWNIAANAARYQAFRNTSGDITSATMFRELPGNNNVSFFDPNDQTSALRYYWIRGVSAKGEAGPFSAMVSATNFYALNGTAVGVDAIAAGSNGTAVGKGADSGTGLNNTAVGVSASIAASINSCTVVGQGITHTGPNTHATTLVGQGIGSSATTGVAIGADIDLGAENDIAIGYRAATASGGGSNIVIGRETVHTGTGVDNVIIGTSSAVSGGRSTGIGQGVTIAHNDCVVIGKGGTTTANSQVIIGTISSPIVTVWFGRGPTHTGVSQTTEIHTSDGSGTNIEGDHFAFYTGAGTGTGIGGDWSIYQSAAGSSGTALNAHALAARLTSTGRWSVAGSGPHVFGGSVNTRFMFDITGTLTMAAGNSGAGLRVDPTLTAGANQDLYMIQAGGTLTKVSGTHPLFASIALTGTSIAGAAGTVTEAAQLYIGGALSGGSSSYAIRVAAGTSYFSGQVQTDTAGFGLGTSPDANAIFNLGGSFSGGATDIYGFLCAPDLDPPNGSNGFGARFTMEFDTIGTSSVHTYAETVRIEPLGIGDAGSSTITNATTLHITGAPSAGSSNYGLWVEGATRIDALTATSGVVLSNTYTPTLTNVANLDGSTAYEMQYIRIGSTVSVSGRIDVNPTAAAGTFTQLGVSLPISSNIGDTSDVAGAGSAAAVLEGLAVTGDAANNRAEVQFAAQSTADHGVWVVFNYQII